MTEVDIPELDELAWEQAAAHHDRAAELVASGKVEAAQPIALAAAEALGRAVGEQHPDYANALTTLAWIAEHLGRLPEAIELGRRALAILEPFRAEAVVEPIRGLASTQLSYQLALAGQYVESEQLAREALALAPKQHPFEATAWVNLGVSLRLAGHHEQAAAAYGRAVSAYEAANEPIPTGLHHNLAGLAFARADHALAEVHARAALASREQSELSDGFGRGQDLCGLGDVLAGQGQFDRAEQAYREGLACYERAGRAEHVEVAFALHNLADVLANSERVAEAEVCYRKSIALKHALLGADHHELAASLANLAVLWAGSDRLAEAQPLCARALEIVQSLAEHHPIRVGVEACARDLG